MHVRHKRALPHWRLAFPAFDISIMALLSRYLRGYWPLVVLALVLAAINQVFSLLDPLIFRHVINNFATQYDQSSTPQFLRGVTLLLSHGVGVAFVSRVAKNSPCFCASTADVIVVTLPRCETGQTLRT